MLKRRRIAMVTGLCLASMTTAVVNARYEVDRSLLETARAALDFPERESYLRERVNDRDLVVRRLARRRARQSRRRRKARSFGRPRHGSAAAATSGIEVVA